jgi:hypothetical protein
VTRRAFTSIALVLGCCGVVAAQGPRPATHPDLSGYWELRFDSFNVPRAALTAVAQMAVDARRAKDQEAIRGCVNIGMPALMDDRGTLDIRQSPAVVGMVARSPSSMRNIYTDGRKHPDADELEGTTNGHSIGRWDNDALVVDAIGFNERGITAIPGGGYRTSRSHLTERYQLSAAGDRLIVTFTWTDPAVFRRAHTYTFRYYRVQTAPEPRVLQCIPNDAERARFLSEAPRSALQSAP